MSPTNRTRALLERLMRELDYAALGEVYCDAGGERFWQDRRAPVVALGAAWAAELAARVVPQGRSLYVGAGVAELPVLLTEVLDLGRACAVASLRARECDVLNAALATVGLAERLRFEAGDAVAIAKERTFDHLSLVSVLSDPETFPQLSALAYGRASPLDFDGAAFDDERARVRALVGAVLARLLPPAIVTTTFEEAPWILEAAGRLGLRATGDDTMVETAVVGDPVGFLRIEGSS